MTMECDNYCVLHGSSNKLEPLTFAPALSTKSMGYRDPFCLAGKLKERPRKQNCQDLPFYISWLFQSQGCKPEAAWISLIYRKGHSAFNSFQFIC